ncbi:MAG TPA: flagellar motor protein MotB [Terriglobales bacterium]|nr:flagellar motor protein MotB [Terriglobales bacterium]
MKGEEVRVRIIRKKGHGDGHHGGAWKVAYADFVTTLMALFIVLWIVGQNESVKQAVAQHFRQPTVAVFKDPKTSAMTAGGDGILPAERAGGGLETDGEGRAAEERALQEAAEKIRQLTEKGGGFEDLKEQIRSEITAEGLRIELMERDGKPFFEVGSAVLIHPLRPLLEKLHGILGGLPNAIAIEGHTDSRRYSQQRSYTNWELSVDRANSARRVLEGAGLPAERMDRVVGHADRLLLFADRPLDPGNRRITLLVLRQKRG